MLCRLELAFPYLVCQKFREKRMFQQFLAENRFLSILCVFSVCSKFEVALILCRHSDVIRRRMVLILYQWKEVTHSYRPTLVANIRV